MDRKTQNVRFSFGGGFTPVVRLLLWANGLVFLFLWLAEGRGFDARLLLVHTLGLVPREVTHNFALWQPFTYMFVHTSFMHVFWNMLGLYWFGPEVERHFGSKLFWRFWLFTGIGGALAAIALSGSSEAVTIGASGACFGVMVAYGFLFPNRTLWLYFVLPVRAIYCVLIFAAITLYMVWAGSGGGVSHIAHLGGMIFGALWFVGARGRTRFALIWHALRRHRLRRRLRLISKKMGDEEDPPGYDGKTVH